MQNYLLQLFTRHCPLQTFWKIFSIILTFHLKWNIEDIRNSCSWQVLFVWLWNIQRAHINAQWLKCYRGVCLHIHGTLLYSTRKRCRIRRGVTFFSTKNLCVLWWIILKRSSWNVFFSLYIYIYTHACLTKKDRMLFFLTKVHNFTIFSKLLLFTHSAQEFLPELLY